MKWLFYLLLLANAGFLVWNYYGLSLSDVHGLPAPETRGAPLVLLSEPASQARSQKADGASRHLRNAAEAKVKPKVEPKPAAPAAKSEATAESAPTEETRAAKQTSFPWLSEESVDFRCFRLAGVESEKQAIALARRLKESGATLFGRGVERTSRPGYWVFLPPAGSDAEARQTLSYLKRKKIRDYYLVLDDQNKNAISLGVFSQRNLAQARLAQINRLGLRPVISDLTLRGRSHWLSFGWREQAAEHLGAFPGAREVACPAGAAKP